MSESCGRFSVNGAEAMGSCTGWVSMTLRVIGSLGLVLKWYHWCGDSRGVQIAPFLFVCAALLYRAVAFTTHCALCQLWNQQGTEPGLCLEELRAGGKFGQRELSSVV